MENSERLKLKARISQSFRPSAPIDRMALFSGRTTQADKIIESVFQTGQHVILYGERGVGKTSMAKVTAEILGDAGFKTVNSDTINCDLTDDFSSLWTKALRELSFNITRTAHYLGESHTIEEVNLLSLVPENITPDDVRRALSTLDKTTIVVFDEFDRLSDSKAKTLMADTIKTLSDHSVKTTLIFVGVAQSVIDLIGKHESIERAIVQVRMPRMSITELSEIINRGLIEAEMEMDDLVRDKIARLSHGLPHYTHLLTLNSGLAAIDQGRTRITDEDFGLSIHQIVEDRHSVAINYHDAITSAHKDSTFNLTLLACALCKVDDQGCFTATQVADTLTLLHQKPVLISNFQRHLGEFTLLKRGGVLERFGSQRNYRYRFSNPLLQPYTLIRSLSSKLITESQLWMMGEQIYK